MQRDVPVHVPTCCPWPSTPPTSTGTVVAIADDIAPAGGEVRWVPLDVTDRQQLEDLVTMARDAFG